MAVLLPNGITFEIASNLKETAVTGIANGKDPAVTLATGTLVADDIVVVNNDWPDVRERVFKVGASNNITGVDTTSTTSFPSTASAGKLFTVTDWVPIVQVVGISTSGGEMNYVTYRFLENSFESQLPGDTSALSLTLTLGFDPDDRGQELLDFLAEARSASVLKLQGKQGYQVYYYCYVGFQSTPIIESGNIMTVTATFSSASRPTRYKSK